MNGSSEYHDSYIVIAGFGNPLLDISVSLKKHDILAKFNLKPDGQKEVNHKDFDAILASLKSENYEVTFSPGGCTQNTLRVVQALVKRENYSVYFGGLGDDKEGDLLESELKKCGVNTRYAKHPDHATGRVVALINGENRSLVAHLGAAEMYSLRDFQTYDNLKIFEEVLIVYIEGFFITHSFDVAMEAASLCKEHGVVLVFNISGAYVAEAHPEALLSMATVADIVIGNSAEFKGLATILKLESSEIEELAVRVHDSLWSTSSLVDFKLSQMNRFGKTIIITQGKDTVLCVCGDRSVMKFEVPYLDPKHVKDPTGAGDAFAAGFLVAFHQNKSAKECISHGCATAQEVIQHIGVQM